MRDDRCGPKTAARMSLTYDVDGCMYMTYGSCQRCAERRASQPRPRAAATVRPTTRGSRAVGTGAWNITSASVSLLATSSGAEAASAGQRGDVSLYRQAPPPLDST